MTDAEREAQIRQLRKNGYPHHYAADMELLLRLLDEAGAEIGIGRAPCGERE